MSSLCVVLTTLPDRAQAEDLGNKLVAEKLVACAQVTGPITSFFSWKSAPQQDQEFQVSLKTLQDRWTQVQQRILQLHPYETPQIIRLPVDAAHPAYERWVKSCLDQ